MVHLFVLCKQFSGVKNCGQFSGDQFFPFFFVFVLTKYFQFFRSDFWQVYTRKIVFYLDVIICGKRDSHQRKCGLFQCLHKINSKENKRDKNFLSHCFAIVTKSVKIMALFLQAFYVSFSSFYVAKIYFSKSHFFLTFQYFHEKEKSYFIHISYKMQNQCQG